MNRKAYAEVYQIIQYLPESEYRCIPAEYIKFLKTNMDTSMKKNCGISTNIVDIELSLDAKAIFLNLYYNFIASLEQKIKLEKILLNEEKKSLEKYYNTMFIAPTEKECRNFDSTELIVKPKENKEKNTIFY